MAAGIIALLLSARPELGWRDVQYLIVQTAKITDPKDLDWTNNGAGYRINHKYGFGNLDASALVNASMNHTLVPSPALTSSVQAQAGLTIPFSSPDEHLEHSLFVHDVGQVQSLEHVQVTVRISHLERRFLTIRLISPAGTESILATERTNDMSQDGFMPWTFGTVRCWGESPIGEWKLQISDSRWALPPGAAPIAGTLLSWGLTIYGICGPEDTVLNANGRPTCTESLRLVSRSRLPLALTVFAITAGMVLTAGMWVFFRYRERKKAIQYLLIPTISPSSAGTDLESATPSTGNTQTTTTSSGSRTTPTFMFRTYEPSPSPTKLSPYEKKSPLEPASPALGASSGPDPSGVIRFAADLGKTIIHKFEGLNGGMRTNWSGEYLMVRGAKAEDEAKSPIFVPQSELRTMPSAREFSSAATSAAANGLRVSLDKVRRAESASRSSGGGPSSPIERTGSPQRP